MCVDGFITEEDLTKIFDQLKSVQTSAALVGKSEAKTQEEFEQERLRAHYIRKSNISFIHGDEWNWLYDKLCDAVNYVNANNYSKVLYGITPLQYSEYDSKYNGFYGPHIDSTNDIKDALHRSLSFSIQLVDGDTYEGGDLNVYSNNITYTANRKLGMITFFDSNCLHEVTPVTSGFRKSLVGWVVGPRV